MTAALRPCLTLGVALVVASLVVATPVAPPPSEIHQRAVRLAATDLGDPATTIGLIMGGSGIPLPNFQFPGYVAAAQNLYIDNPGHPNFPGTTEPNPYANGLFTPENWYPFSGDHNEYVNYPLATSGPLAGFPDDTTSMGQGMVILDNAIQSNLAAGDASTVFGYSQSTAIEGYVQQQLDPAGTPSSLPINFVMIGDVSNPNGGILERFDGLTMPTLGATLTGAQPVDDFPTDVYTAEYDGWADFPRYPLNTLADLNALIGMETIHGIYLSAGLANHGAGPSAADIANATLLPGSAALGTPDTLTNFYMIDETPPLVTLLSSIPGIGKPLADLLGPDLTVLINLGYGADNLGYSDAPANVPTPFGLFPDVNPSTVFNELVTGAQQGFTAFESDLSHLSLSSLLSSASSAATDTAPAALPSLPDFLNGIGSAFSALYTWWGTATGDLVNAALTALPGYDLTLFQDNISDPINAIGLPIAANTGLLTLLEGFAGIFFTAGLDEAMADLGLGAA